MVAGDFIVVDDGCHVRAGDNNTGARGVLSVVVVVG